MKNLRMLFCMLMGLLIGSVLGIVIANLTHNQQKKKHAQMAATEVTATADATAGDVATPMEEQMHTAQDATGTDAAVPDAAQPEALTEILNRSLVSYAQLAEVSCRQLVVVDADHDKATISMYICDTDGKWTDTGLTTEGYVGANGVSRESYEGSRMTPAGVFPIGEAFYFI